MIGILGGTFDPVHHGHLRIALDALEAIGLSQVRLVPLAQAVHRDQPAASPQQRLTMLQQALNGHPALLADAREIERGGPSYMIDTLQSLHDEFPDRRLCLLVGTDAFNGFAEWHRPERILQLAHLVVLQRPGYRPPQTPALARLTANRSAEAPRQLADSPAGLILFHTVTQLDIASSDIRQRIAGGRDPSFLLPQPVLDYIRAEGLYR
jgi:nicotinate-nucleotide adenylyltransferase